MTRTQTPPSVPGRSSPVITLTERLCRPQRIGVFGHRGVGKTTLLTMLYREGIAGRLPGLRIAAADARTASYLSDKVLQLERGEPLPATLGETELRFNLYKGSRAIELVVLDYQGEHVTLGRHEPVHDFLRECDAVWLCLDVPSTQTREASLTAQQEVEQMVEEYLTASRELGVTRPMAVVLTKADLLDQPQQYTQGPTSVALQELITERLPATRHVLASHHSQQALFAVSSLGYPAPPAPHPEDITEEPNTPTPPSALPVPDAQPLELQPAGLHGPLDWLTDALELQDEARVRRLWCLAPGKLDLLTRAVNGFTRRYPDAPASRAFRTQLRQQKRRHLSRRLLVGGALGVLLFLLVGAYEWLGLFNVRRFAHNHGDDPVAVEANYRSYQTWHPFRKLYRMTSAPEEEQYLDGLQARVQDQKREQALASLRQRANNPDLAVEALWGHFQEVRQQFPDYNLSAEEEQLRARLKTRVDGERQRQARLAFEELEQAEGKKELPQLIALANQILANYRDTPYAQEAELRRTAYLEQLDEQDWASARDYSVRNPENYYTRQEHYRQYLAHHPTGKYADQARQALVDIDDEWDRHDFRLVRDQFIEDPGEVEELAARCSNYLAAHPSGRYRDKAVEVRRWIERVKTPGEYTVTLVSGAFEDAVAAYLSRGPSLSVEIEVNGERHGPSNIVKRRYDPDWDYKFPRKIRWKLGDPVRIYVTDHYFWRRSVLTVASEHNDQLAIRLLSGEVVRGKNRLRFRSDFHMPELPKIE
jgi:GTPase SAR1 family protein